MKIAFEYDGTYWHERRKKEDRKRDSELNAMGWATFRVSGESLKILSQQPIFTIMKNLS